MLVTTSRSVRSRSCARAGRYTTGIGLKLLLRDQHIIHVRVAGEPPFAGKRIVDDTGPVDHPYAAAPHKAREFVRRDETLPFMRALGQPAQHVFGADDRQ